MDSLPNTIIKISYEEEIVVVKKGYGRGKYQRPPNLKGLTGKWTKWGRVTQDFQQEIEDEWTCQSCASRMPRELSPYKYPFAGETIRVCASCLNNNCLDLQERLQSQS